MADRIEQRLTADTLWSAVDAHTRRALESGALVPLRTSIHVIEDGGIPFVLRIARNLERKERFSQPSRNPPRNPFAPPYEPELHLGRVTDSHVALLNKFNVLERHLLLVTRDYADQRERLTQADFEAMLLALVGIDGLAFYNGGAEAGASQPHKHLQLVPLPLAPQGPALPFASLLEEACVDRGIGRIPQLPFPHALTRMPQGWRQNPERAAVELQRSHERLFSTLGFEPRGRYQPCPYNLLATHDWLWLIPRVTERFEGISINALGFAGALLVRDEAQYRRLSAAGPLQALASVVPSPAGHPSDG